MTVVAIPITKGAASIDMDTEKLPEAVYFEALKLGLKELANRGMSKITVAKLEGDDLAKARAAAMEVAAKNAEKIMKGDIRFSGAKAATKVSGAVNTEAMRIARGIVKDTLKANNLKISHYKASEITVAAKALLAQDDGTILKTAEENLAKRSAPVEGKIDLKALIGGMKEDPELVAKAEAAKAKKKETLSAKQAGMVAPRAKGKPAQATAH